MITGMLPAILLMAGFYFLFIAPQRKKQKEHEKMLAALTGIAENRDDDAAILSQENGKIRFEAWIDSLVLELRWKLALSHADEVNGLSF